MYSGFLKEEARTFMMFAPQLYDEGMTPASVPLFLFLQEGGGVGSLQ